MSSSNRPAETKIQEAPTIESEIISLLGDNSEGINKVQITEPIAAKRERPRPKKSKNKAISAKSSQDSSSPPQIDRLLKNRGEKGKLSQRASTQKVAKVNRQLSAKNRLHDGAPVPVHERPLPRHHRPRRLSGAVFRPGGVAPRRSQPEGCSGSSRLASARSDPESAG